MALNRDSASSIVVFEEFVRGSQQTSPLIKPFLAPGGWQGVKCLYLIEGFSRLVIDVVYFVMENRFFFKSFSFVY